MNLRNCATKGHQGHCLRGGARFCLALTLLVTILGLLGPTTAPPALAGPAAAPAAQTNTLTLNVISARTEPDAPGGPVLRGDKVTEYKYLINVDNTGDPDQGRNAGCFPTNPGYPDSCDWPSIREMPGAAPIFTQGDQTDFGPGIDLPPGKYLISVLADGYKLDGAHFSVPLSGPVTVELQPHPLPAATMRIKVFEDISPVNGQFDAPAEQGLAGFTAVINDTVGQISTDVFGNPLCTEYDADMNPIDQTDCLTSDANGDIVIPNLGPLRYDVLVNPPDGTGWTETTTLEGSPSWDTWLQEGGTGLDNEFVVAGEPFPWTVFGFVRPQNSLAGGSGGVKGTLVSASVYLPQQGGLPYYGDIWTGFNGNKVTGPITDGWVALSDLQNGDTAIYVGRANSNGTFQINNVPNGNYLFTWWDTKLHYILDWIQVTVSDGQMYDMGTPFLTGWFTKVDGYVFNDLNKNGVKDPGEPGLANYLVVLRDRDNSEIDRMSIAVTTDPNGYYVFEKAYPMGSWMVLEAYNDRFYTTGVTYQVDNQPAPTTVPGNGVDVGLLPILGQPARLDWGVHAYEPGTNGGIVGSVFYDTTRNELDQQYQAVEPWAAGIPNLAMNLYATVPCGTNPGTPCDARVDYELTADGSYAKGQLLNTTTTEIWEQPTGCTARDANGNPLQYPNDQELFANPGPADYRCLESPVMGTQLQSGFATLDGNWGFADGCFGPGNYALEEGVCAIDEPTPLPGASDYLVEVVIPDDDFGRPLYQVVREEDINVFGGDQYIPAVPPPACAGALHTVDVAGILPDGPDAVDNPSFVDAGGSPYEGMPKPLCDVKLVNLANGKSVAPLFTLFTEVPIPGKWRGYIIDDLTVSTNPQDLNFGEKAGIPNSPIGIYDFTSRLLTTIHSDPNGVFEVLLPSTYTTNYPSPSGVCPNIYYMLANGGTNLAGAVGIFSGSEGYEVAHNDICGNFSAEYGGGISHYGLSPNGKIHHNRIYFNRSYDEGGGIIIAGELPANPTNLSTGAGPVDVYNNLIQNNLGNDDGGGLRFLMAGNFPYNVYNNIVVNNVSTHEGGGVSLNDAPDVRFYNNTVMKNITTATAVTSNGFPAPAGLSTSRNSTTLQATLPGGSSIFSNPLLFNNVFWDNRAGTFTGATVAGIGLAGDPNPINNWDLGVADGTGLLAPTNSLLQVTTGTIPDGSNIVGTDPNVVTTYDTSVSVQPWRGNPRFVDILMVTALADANVLGDYHLQSGSPAIEAGATSKGVINAPGFDFDDQGRPAGTGFDIGADEANAQPLVGLSASTDSLEEQPAEPRSEQPAEPPADQPVEPPADQPAEQPAEAPADQPIKIYLPFVAINN